ncbi:hypothetical protein OLP55_01910 [Campylobacter jejuni]|nr:hypothetical protein [Campylobacter jejuni]
MCCRIRRRICYRVIKHTPYSTDTLVPAHILAYINAHTNEYFIKENKTIHGGIRGILILDQKIKTLP